MSGITILARDPPPQKKKNFSRSFCLDPLPGNSFLSTPPFLRMAGFCKEGFKFCLQRSQQILHHSEIFSNNQPFGFQFCKGTDTKLRVQILVILRGVRIKMEHPPIGISNDPLSGRYGYFLKPHCFLQNSLVLLKRHFIENIT